MKSLVLFAAITLKVQNSQEDLSLPESSRLMSVCSPMQIHGKEAPLEARWAQSCPTLCNPMDSSPPGSRVHGIFPARILEWVAISFSRVIVLTQGSNLRLHHLLHWQADPLPLRSKVRDKGKGDPPRVMTPLISGPS